ncbi:MAG: hypothetical protein Q9212_003841 [Teloschistes hypoglaucus]
MVGPNFNDMPLEIRRMIYFFAKPDVAVLSEIAGRAAIRECEGLNVWQYKMKGLPLLQLDRRTRAEATTLLYEKCTFALSLRYDPMREEFVPARPHPDDPSSTLSMMPGIQNWVIELKWNTVGWGEWQAIDLCSRLTGVSNLLSKCRRIDSLEVHFGCLCSMEEHTRFLMGRWARNRKLDRSQASVVIDYVLEPLKSFPVIKNAAFVPIKWVGREDRRAAHREEICREEKGTVCQEGTCLSDLRVITEDVKRCLEGESRSEGVQQNWSWLKEMQQQYEDEQEILSRSEELQQEFESDDEVVSIRYSA